MEGLLEWWKMMIHLMRTDVTGKMNMWSSIEFLLICCCEIAYEVIWKFLEMIIWGGNNIDERTRLGFYRWKSNVYCDTGTVSVP